MFKNNEFEFNEYYKISEDPGSLEDYDGVNNSTTDHRNQTMKISSGEFEFKMNEMEFPMREEINYDSDIVNQLVYNVTNTTDEELPIDMQFNDGHLISITVYSILFVCSAIGNLTVLIMLLRRRKARAVFPPIDFMLLHLAIADLVVTFLMMPLEIVWNVTVSWNAGDFLCRIMAFFRIFGLFLSSFVLVCLAVDRYMAIKYPLQILAGLRRSRRMIMVSWLLSILCSFPQVLIFHVDHHPKFPWYTQCITYSSFPSVEWEMAYFLFGMFFMYLGPFIIIVFLYCGIVIELIRRHRECSHQMHVSNDGVDGLRRSGIGNLGKAKEKALKMSVLIAAIFFICWSPYYAISLWYWIDEASFKKVDQRIQKALFLFACTNSTANPIVYGIFHLKSSFRRPNEFVRRGVMGESMRKPLDRCVSFRPGTIANGNSYINTRESNTPRFNGRLKEHLIMNDTSISNDDTHYTIQSSASFV